MGKYIKLFETHADYAAYIGGSDKILPNVSYCENENEVHYNPWTDPKLVCKYNITDTSSATALRTEYEPNMFKSMEIDGVLLDSLVTEYQFSTTGEHTVKYELYDETKVGNSAPLFYNINTLVSISIPNSVTTISSNAFVGCSGLTNITIPNSVTSIGVGAFSNCSGLTSITIPSSVTSIGDGAFASCSGLTSITVDSSNTVYDSRNNCNAIIKTSTNTLIACCQNTVIPNSVTTIGYNAFNNCSGLTSITIPSSVTSIGHQAFYSCSGLTSVTIQATTPPTLGNSAFYNTNNCPIYVPSASVETYKAATNWSSLASRIQATP